MTGELSLTLLVLENSKFRKATLDDYKEAVYMLLNLIPLGKVTTYNSIAKLLGIHPRLVARILAENKEPIIIPCHRVVKSDLSIGGYTPAGPTFKKKLLELEGVMIKGGKVSRSCLIDLRDILGY